MGLFLCQRNRTTSLIGVMDGFLVPLILFRWSLNFEIHPYTSLVLDRMSLCVPKQQTNNLSKVLKIAGSKFFCIVESQVLPNMLNGIWFLSVHTIAFEQDIAMRSISIISRSFLSATLAKSAPSRTDSLLTWLSLYYGSKKREAKFSVKTEKMQGFQFLT